MSNENREDPREGVRFAYLVLNPSHNDKDYEDWCEKHEPTDGELDHHEAFAAICKNAILTNPEIKRFKERSICFAGGFHTAMSHIAMVLDYVTSQGQMSRSTSVPAED